MTLVDRGWRRDRAVAAQDELQRQGQEPAGISRQTVLFVGADARYMFQSRWALIERSARAGYRPIVLEGPVPGYDERKFSELGAGFIPWDLAKTSINPFADIRNLWRLWCVLRAIKPDIVFAHTLKPIVYTAIVAKLVGIRRSVILMAGLGYAFAGEAGLARNLIRTLARACCRVALQCADLVLFQNPDDRQELLERGVLRPGTPTTLVNGSGVDMSRFRASPLPDGPVTFLMLSRLLRDKGVLEFVEAARRVKCEIPDTRFILVGEADKNPEAIPECLLEEWRSEGVVEVRGFTTEPEAQYAASHVYVLPTFHREGIPRGILEAMSSARPVITTDTPGCREAVAHGRNGLFIPPRDVEALAEAMLSLARDRQRIQEMGEAGREICAERYELEIVTCATLRFLLGQTPFAEKPREHVALVNADV